jgi:hypothetical protein
MQDRWLHIRQPAGFSEEMFRVFCASAEVFVAHASALLRVYKQLPRRSAHSDVQYTFHAPELSSDKTVASLRISGANTVATRSDIEIGCCYILWQFFPTSFMSGLEQGRTEEGNTQWWQPWSSIAIQNADPKRHGSAG